MANVADITPAELKKRLDNGERIDVIDVRESWELAITRLSFARHIRMIEILSRLPEIPRDCPVVFLCRTGSRSTRTVEILQLRGYNNVYNLEGGILAWARDVDSTLPQFYI
ncbi:MAG: rhodanese-like domain-containing protein [Aggregatilineales bacterium]